MAGPGRTVLLSRPSNPPRARFGRFWRWGRGRPSPSSKGVASDPLLEVGRQLRTRREARQLSLRELALETRISTPVLEALERGWRDRLPEPAYLRTMLPLIERHLDLEPGSLERVLPVAAAPAPGQQRQGLLRRFTPGSIDVFTTWQGTVLYGVLTLGLVYALNLQQQRLAQEGLLAVRPVPPLSQEEQGRRPPADQALLAVEPGLRPLQQASQGVGLGLLRSGASGRGERAPVQEQGTLMARLEAPTTVSLEDGTGTVTSFQSSGGTLEFRLNTPWTLRLVPAPSSSEAVRWKGNPLRPEKDAAGMFRPPQPPAAKPQPR